MRCRSLVALTSLTALTLAAAGAGAAQAQAPTTLTFVGKSQDSVGFFPHVKKPKAGMTFGFGDTITGDDTGVDRGVCTLVTRSQAVCIVQLQLAKGTISAQGMQSITSTGATPFSIVGGTGAYSGIRGSAIVTTNTSDTTTIAATLVP
jgi:hypothetical protein